MKPDYLSDEWYCAFREQMEELQVIRDTVDEQMAALLGLMHEIKQMVDNEYRKKYENEQAVDGREPTRNMR